MKRRKKFNFIPVNRCLHHSMMSDVCQKHQPSLPEKLGLKPISRVSNPYSEQDCLTRWKSESRHPVCNSQQPLVKTLVIAARNNHPMTFVYHGGSTPGAKRTVFPAEVFTVGVSDNVFLSGWCTNQQAHRTFRIDRLELVIKS